jgi:hypothetical protein
MRHHSKDRVFITATGFSFHPISVFIFANLPFTSSCDDSRHVSAKSAKKDASNA